MQFFSFGFSCEIDNFANFLLLKNLNLSCHFSSEVTNCSLPADHSIMYSLDEILQFHEMVTFYHAYGCIASATNWTISRAKEWNTSSVRFLFPIWILILLPFTLKSWISDSHIKITGNGGIFRAQLFVEIHIYHVNFSMLNNVKPEFSHSQSLCCVNKRPHRFCVYHEPKNMFNISRQRKTETKNGSEEMVKSKTYNNENHLLKL